jgi:hypothetical protein
MTPLGSIFFDYDSIAMGLLLLRFTCLACTRVVSCRRVHYSCIVNVV